MIFKPCKYMEEPHMHVTKQKKDNLRRVLVVWLQLCDLLEKASYGNNKRVSAFQSLGKDRRIWETQDLKQWKFLVWYYSGGWIHDIILLSDPWNAKHQEWTLRLTVRPRWQWSVNVASLIRTRVRFRYGMLVGEVVWLGQEVDGNSVLTTQPCCEVKQLWKLSIIFLNKGGMVKIMPDMILLIKNLAEFTLRLVIKDDIALRFNSRLSQPAIICNDQCY